MIHDYYIRYNYCNTLIDKMTLWKKWITFYNTHYSEDYICLIQHTRYLQKNPNYNYPIPFGNKYSHIKELEK